MITLIPCFKCNTTKPVDLFYNSTIKKGGVTGECKSCVIERVKVANSKAHRQTWFTSEQFKKENCEQFKKYVAKYPERHNIRQQTNRAINSGKLIRPDYCVECNFEVFVEAHHDDYNKPLSIRWLCKKCHGLWHRYNTPLYQTH